MIHAYLVLHLWVPKSIKPGLRLDSFMQTEFDMYMPSSFQSDDWVAMEDDNFKGVRVVLHDGHTVSMSTRRCRDADRWRTAMPDLAHFPTLIYLDLDRSRYLTTLHESIGTLQQLKVLKLTRCSRLEQVPDSICHLRSLEVVSNPKAFVLCIHVTIVASLYSCPSKTRRI